MAAELKQKAQKFTDLYLDRFDANYKKWNYEDGCVLRGARLMYDATQDEKYIEFIKNYFSHYINNDGTINHYELEEYNIDKINTGKMLIFMYKHTKEEKYFKAAQLLREQLKNHPRCTSGNFFHKKIYPYQIWLDGVYMGLPFLMEFDIAFGNKDVFEDIFNQFKNVDKYLYDSEKKLHYHAYDESKSIFWCNKETGKSKNFWLRSAGWHLMALVDIIEIMDKEKTDQYNQYIAWFKQTLDGLLQYQDAKSKLFYQVIDRSDVEGNYLESSGSSMIAYSILSACNLGIIDKETYYSKGMEILESLIETKIVNENDLMRLKDNCSVAGLGPIDNPRRDGSVEYYLSEPITLDDKKAVGAFIMAYAKSLK